MANTTNHPNNELIHFQDQLLYDFLRSSPYDQFIGDTPSSPIYMLRDLKSKGRQINVPLVTQLSGRGVGSGVLSGREEVLDSGAYLIFADWKRNALKTDKNTSKESSFALKPVFKQTLREWARNEAIVDMTNMLLAIPTNRVQADRGGDPGNSVNGITWSASTAAEKNAWWSANSDRVLAGVGASNYATTWAASMANIDSAADKMSSAIGERAKAMARQTGVTVGTTVRNGRPRITPYRVESDNIKGVGRHSQEWYTCLMGMRAFRDLKADMSMATANREAREREGRDPTMNNPLFTGGALVKDGIIYVEIPEITQYLTQYGVGFAGIDVEPYFLMGKGAYAYATGQMPIPTELDNTDYGFFSGYGVEAQYGVGKIAKSPLSDGAGATAGQLVDWGVVTGFVAALPDA